MSRKYKVFHEEDIQVEREKKPSNEKAEKRIKLFPEKKCTYSRDKFKNYVMYLHQKIGNQAVAEMFENRDIQAMLHLSHPKDYYEIEADKVAEKVVSQGNSECDKCHQIIADILRNQRIRIAKKRQALMSPKERYTRKMTGGVHLTDAERVYYEERFNHDFGDVRIHKDAKAAELAETINAKAFTHGNDIVFAEGQYQPGTIEGKKLIAHELTHVIQQEGRQHEIIQRKDRIEKKSKKSKISKGKINKGAKYTFVISGTTDISGLRDDNLQMKLSRKYFLTSDGQLDSEASAAEFAQMLGSEKYRFFEWMGDNIMSTQSEKKVSMKDQSGIIYKEIIRLTDIEESNSENKLKINLVGHSHGGNIMVLVANMLMENNIPVEIYNLITLSAPVRQDCQIDDKYIRGINHISLFSFLDFVQTIGFLDQNTYVFAIIGLFTSAFFAAIRYFGGMGCHRFKNADKNINITKYRNLFPRKEYREKIRKQVKDIGKEEWKNNFHKFKYSADAPLYFHQITRSVKFIKEILNKEGLL